MAGPHGRPCHPVLAGQSSRTGRSRQAEVFEEFTVAAAEAAFLPLPDRQRLIDEAIRSGYALR